MAGRFPYMELAAALAPGRVWFSAARHSRWRQGGVIRAEATHLTPVALDALQLHAVNGTARRHGRPA